MVYDSAHESTVLLVAERPDASRALACFVRRRGQGSRSRFTLLVPAVAHGLHRVVDPEDECCEAAARTIGSLRPAIERAAGEPIATMIGSHEPLAAVEDALNRQDFDEIVLAIRPSRLARLAGAFHLDLARKIKALGLPVTLLNLDLEEQPADAFPPRAHSRQEAEVEALVRALRGHGVLTRARLAEASGAAHWSDSGFNGALAEAIAAGRIRRLGDDLYEVGEPTFR
jgi:hypothetical protein